MNGFKKGTPAFGLVLGLCFAGLGVLVMTIGFWKTLLLAVLFGLGYFLGAVQDKSAFLKETANQVIPEKKDELVDFRSEVVKEQEARMNPENKE